MSSTDAAKSIVVPSETIVRAQQASKTALSLALCYWLALYLNWDLPKYGALAIVLISLDTTGASLQKGVMRMIGTTVGLAVGLLGLALFAQDRWLTLLYLASYLTVIGYFMQASRYPYAWFVAGFLPSLVWATTYGKIDNAFHYATFRYLETSAGIVIYTLVSALLWPRYAGAQLAHEGTDFCAGLSRLFGLYRRRLEAGDLPSEAAELRNRLAGSVPRMLATLEAAYTDTPSVAARKRAWEVFRVNARAIDAALELWRQTIDDCRRLDMDRLMPQIHSALATIDRRFARIDHLWQVRSARQELKGEDAGDDLLLEPLQLEVSRDLGADLSRPDRAALLSFVQQLTVLDLTSSELLRTMRVLAGLAPVRALKQQLLPLDLYRPSRWDPARLIKGLLPAVCFTAAYFFWICFDPPTGPNVPNMAATFGLLTLMTSMNVLVLIPIVLVAIWGIVAPVYFFVMPRLSTGLELLTFIFGFAFVVGLFGGRLAPLKTLTLVMFVMLTGISNQQSYSFMGLVDGALMMILALCVVAVVQTLLNPSRPEQSLLHSVRRFFCGCAGVGGGYSLAGPARRDQRRWLRKRCFESMILPAIRKVQAAQNHLDFKLFPDNTPEKVQRLLDGMQNITYRLQALEIAHQLLVQRALEYPESFAQVESRVRTILRRVFEGWASLEPHDEFEQQRGALQTLVHDLREQFDALENRLDSSDQVLTDLYTLLGSVRGLIEAMADAQGAINQINWQQWATPRF
jgi:uncharacterized membrane protein YccC